MIFFIETKFQETLGVANSASEIIDTRRVGYLELIFCIIKNVKKNEILVFCDHRNFWLNFFLAINLLRSKNILIAEDGMHTYLIDMFREKYLFLNVQNKFKKLLIQINKKKLVELRRIYAHQNYIDYLKTRYNPDKKNKKKNIFIDIPLFHHPYPHNKNYNRLYAFLKKNDIKYVAVHPKSDKEIYKFLDFEVLNSKDSLEYIVDMNLNVRIYGVASTVMISAKKLGIETVLIDAGEVMDNPPMELINEYQKLIESFL